MAKSPNRSSRRTQSEKAQETRDRLCRATLEVIAQVGYRSATTTMIAEHAGVSRGAQTHHFPTKHKLVCAAFEYVLQEWEDQRAILVDKQSTSPITVEDFIRYLWGTYFNHPYYLAILELMLAARGDKKLRRDLTKSVKHMSEQRHLMWRAVFEDTLAEEELEVFMVMTASLFRGLAMQSTVDARQGIEQKVVDVWAGFLEQKTGK